MLGKVGPRSHLANFGGIPSTFSHHQICVINERAIGSEVCFWALVERNAQVYVTVYRGSADISV